MKSPLLHLLHRLLSRTRREEGIALVLALGISVVLGISGTAAVAYTSSNYGVAKRSNADQKALALAEAGLNNAYSVLFNASNPTLAAAVPAAGPIGMEAGTTEWSGTLGADGKTWTLSGTGRVHNPTGPGASDVIRTVSGRATLGSSTRGTANNAVWNYMYADALTGCTNLQNAVNVNIPLYIRGDLCMQNQSQVSGYALQVGGTLTITGPQPEVGSAGSPVHDVHVGGGCSLGGGTYTRPCGAAQRVWSQVPDDSTPTGLTKPPVDLPGMYANAMPGPRHACTQSSGTVPAFDNDTILNRSLPSAVNLAPAWDYSCVVLDAGGAVLGRLDWNHLSGILTVAGTIFFDGDISFKNLNNIVYQGRATIYASGKIEIANQTTLCGVSGCGANWDPTQNLLAFVAGSSTDSSSFSISNFSTFQGAVYAVNDYTEGNNTTMWGPVIARQLYLQNSTINHYVPLGTLLPGMPATYEESVTVMRDPGSWGG